tara:strand:- start:709 stop:1593 length:885 start_codon:yes stop_codon:yes gene_type:complete
MSQGIVFFAHNNTEIDYGSVAIANATMIKHHMGVDAITLITDEGTMRHMNDTWSKEIIDSTFEQIKVAPRRRIENNKRYRDTRHTVNVLPFYNINRSTVYNESPYDETLVIDVDYLICNNSLNAVWNHKEDLLINRKSFDLLAGRHDTSFDRVDDFGIDFYWATAFYFKKSEESKIFFDLLEAIKSNYPYFKTLYNITSYNFRNDHAFSIAVHMFNGFAKSNLVKHLPVDFLQHTLDYDELHDIDSKGSLSFLLEKTSEPGKFIPARTDGVNVHVMNKYSIVRQSKKIVEMYSA